jgi:hypothetical protein
MPSLSSLPTFKPTASGGSVTATYALIPNHAVQFKGKHVREIVMRGYLEDNHLLIPSSGASRAKTAKKDFSDGDRMVDQWREEAENVLKGHVEWTGGKKYVKECAMAVNIPEGAIFTCYLPKQDRFYLCRMGSFESIQAPVDIGLYHVPGTSALYTKEQIAANSIKEYLHATSLIRHVEVIGQVLKEDYSTWAVESGLRKQDAWWRSTGLKPHANCIDCTLEPKHFELV